MADKLHKSDSEQSRSPVIPKQESTGTLKTTISLGKNPAVVSSGPFYLMKEPPTQSELTGATNLMKYHGLERSHNKSTGKKIKDQLSAFLPDLPGFIDAPGHQDNTTLRSLINKPPLVGNELIPLSGSRLVGFRLHPGPLPEQYRTVNEIPRKKKHKHKKDENTREKDENCQGKHEKKHKKRKRHDDKDRKEKKKDKKDKKDRKDRKRKKHALENHQN